MDVAELFVELYGRIPPLVERAVDGLDQDALTRSPEPGSNTIGWLGWHLTRVHDHHISELLDADQLWVTEDWAREFGLEPDPENIGFGHDVAEMEAVRPSTFGVINAYLAAVHARTVDYLQTLTAPDLDRIVDRRWDPPVTLGVRLVSVANDSLQHAGQAAYLRGLLDRRSDPG